MKTKLFLVLGLFITTLGVLLAFGATPVQAKGEKYKWIDSNTVEASGGAYAKLNGNEGDFVDRDTVRFEGSKGFKLTGIFSGGSTQGARCKATLTLTVSEDNKQGKLSIKDESDCRDAMVETLDRSFTVGNAKDGPKLGGSELEYKDGLDCAKEYEGGHPSQRGRNIARCEAVLKCVVDGGESETACLQAWATCMVENKDDTAECEKKVGGGDVGEDEKKPDQTTSCSIDGIGWIICPTVRLLANLVDGTYNVVETFLQVQPLLSAGEEETKGIYDAWSIMRNFANVAFVIAFLVIVFSQVTSLGITNYGIKKMLPRLIVAAILVNISYWICAVAVDISNILGASTKDLFDSIGGSFELPQNRLHETQTGKGWLGMAGYLLTLGAAAGAVFLLYTSLSVFLPLLVGALFTIVSVFIILVLRQALIVLLIVVSPLAFVAYILPNTEDLFTKWRKMFTALLLIYVIVAAVFGASALASKVVTAGANGNEVEVIAIQIMGAALTILPLVIVPALLKAATGLLNRFGIAINDPGKGMFDRMRKSAEDYHDYRKDVNRGERVKRGAEILESEGGKFGKPYNKRRKLAAFVASGGATRAKDVAEKRKFAKAISEENAQNYFAKRALDDTGFAERVGGNEAIANSVKASAQSEIDTILKKDIASREILLKADVNFKNDPKAALQDALDKGDKVQANAAINLLMQKGAKGYDEMHETLRESEAKATAAHPDTMDAIRNHVKENGQAIKAKDPAMVAWAADAKDGSGKAIASTLAMADKEGKLVQKADAELAGFSPEALKRAAPHISEEQARRIIGTPTVIENTNPANIETLRRVAKLPPTPPPT